MFKNILRGLGFFGFLVLNALGGWIIYSRFAIDHNMILPSPLDADEMDLQTSAGRVHAYSDTSGIGRPIVLVHSLNAAASAYEMKPLFEYYAGVRPVYALDLPGFGLSDRSDRQYTPALYIEAVAHLLREVVGEPADVVALSLGGEFSASVALASPEYVHTLTLLAPTGLGNSSQIGEGLYNGLSFPLWSLAIYDLLMIRPTLNFFLEQIFYGDVPADYIDYAYLSGHQPGAKHAPLYFVGGQLFTSDIRTTVYEKLEVPVLAIYGDDPNVSFENLPDLLAKNPLWTAQRFEQTASVPHWDEFEATREALEEHWSKMTDDNTAEAEANVG